MNITQVPNQQAVFISELKGAASVVERLHDLGLFSGLEVKLIGRAPLGGPFIVQIGSLVLALRGEEAACIQVRSSPS